MSALSERAGTYRTVRGGGETWKTFYPAPLPPKPALDLGRLVGRVEAAAQAVGRLDGAASLLIDPALFVYMYVRKEALLSSQIEGTQSSLSDLLLHEVQEAPGVPIDDVAEVSRYVAAMDYGIAQLRAGQPLSLRLIRGMHKLLMRESRGQEKSPGEFRQSQNWIGGTRPGNAAYVPPPADVAVEAMGQLEKFLHRRHGLSPLIEAGLIHVQFETIHPFLDGNGRLGRLLITLLLYERNVLHEPLLYLSLFLKEHRARYYELLTAVRETGVWEDWLAFYLDGVTQTANAAAETAVRIHQIILQDRRTIDSENRAAPSMHAVLGLLQRHPLLTITRAAKLLNMSEPTVTAALGRLEAAGIVRELSGKRRRRLYAYERYLTILAEGTDPLKP